MVICFAGAVDFQRAKDLTEKYFGGLQGGNFKQRDKKIVRYNHTLLKKKDIEQTHLAIGYPSIPRTDRDVECVQIMNTAVGSGMSSRLYQEVREKLGLAYNV
jgi:predicted Zn-dependent peptidase